MTIEDKTLVKNFRSAPAEKKIFLTYPPAKWTPDGFGGIEFYVLDIDESGGNRLAPRERPYRDGAKVDDIGSKAIVWQFVAIFNNTIEEGLYPDRLNELIEWTGKHVTGDLIVPTRGLVRAKAEGYSRKEIASELDQAILTLSFIEDNEDGVGAQNFTSPSAAGSTDNVADETIFDSQSEGMWNGSIQNLKQFSSQLQGLANAPGQYAQDLETAHNTMVGEVENIINTFSDITEDGRSTLLNPSSTKAQRDLELLKELAGQSRQDARQGQKKIITKKYIVEMNILQIATLEDQQVEDLIKINGQIENLLSIPPNTPVRMYSNV